MWWWAGDEGVGWVGEVWGGGSRIRLESGGGMRGGRLDFFVPRNEYCGLCVFIENLELELELEFLEDGLYYRYYFILAKSARNSTFVSMDACLTASSNPFPLQAA